MTNLTAEQIAGIKAATEGASHGPWYAGHLGSGQSCQCAYILDDGHMGGIATVHVLDHENAGSNDAPPKDEATANMRHIANCDPQTISALCDLALRGLAPLPEGYALVPIEPTGEMWVAGRKAYEADAEKYRAADTTAMAMAHADRAPEHIYRAMIAASPAIPTARDGGDGTTDILKAIAALKGKTLISAEHGQPYSIGAHDAFEQAADLARAALSKAPAA